MVQPSNWGYAFDFVKECTKRIIEDEKLNLPLFAFTLSTGESISIYDLARYNAYLITIINSLLNGYSSVNDDPINIEFVSKYINKQIGFVDKNKFWAFKK